MITLVEEQMIIGSLKEKAAEHLDTLWEDYLVAARTYRKLYDQVLLGEDANSRLMQAKNNAHATACEMHTIYEQAKDAYRAIGFVGKIGVHNVERKSNCFI
jgi:hypothetical protein